MKRRKTIAAWFVAACVVLLAGCGVPVQNSGTLPAATNPETQPEQSIPTGESSDDKRLPEWVKTAAPFRLPNPKVYSGLEDLFGVVYTDAGGKIVGDPLIRLEIYGTRTQVPNGKMYFGFEDAKGFIYLDVVTVDGASFRDSKNLDLIFSDDEGAFRVKGLIENGKLTGTLYYRLRASGENQCRKWVICDYSTGRYACREWVDVPACRAYVDLTDTHVTSLGTFETEYLKWVSE